jgi:hypothetical protein
MSDKIGFTKAVMNVFKREQDSQFTAEYRLLTEDDKRDLYHGFQRMGINCEIPLGKDGKPMDVSQNPRNY